MSRRITSSQYESTGQSQQIDGYFDRVIKFVPADIVGGWIAVSGVVPIDTQSGKKSAPVMWLAFAFALILTALWTWKQTGGLEQRPAYTQIIVSSAAFCVWVCALGPPFSFIGGFQSYYGSLLLIGFTIASGMIVPKEG
jgi:hypothetical protein